MDHAAITYTIFTANQHIMIVLALVPKERNIEWEKILCPVTLPPILVSESILNMDG